MIDLKSLAEYGRRSGACLPPQLFPLSAPQHAGQEAAQLLNAWLSYWHDMDEETQLILAQHLGLRSESELHSELVTQGVRLALDWIGTHGEIPQKFEALRRAVSEGK